MEAKLLSVSSSPSFSVNGATKFSRPSFVLTSQTRKFPIFKLHCPARLSKKAVQSVHASTNSIGSKTTSRQRVDESENLTLNAVRYSLIRQEDSIIFSLLERAQYCYNESTYDPDSFSMEGFHGSLVEYMLRETEKLHAQVGRYKSPDEHPFFPDELPDPLLPPLEYPQVLHPIADAININPKVWQMYFGNIIPILVKEGDDGNCGSTAVCDTMCLQVFKTSLRCISDSVSACLHTPIYMISIVLNNLKSWRGISWLNKVFRACIPFVPIGSLIELVVVSNNLMFWKPLDAQHLCVIPGSFEENSLWKICSRM